MEPDLRLSSPRTAAVAALLAAVGLVGGCGGGGGGGGGGTAAQTPATAPPTPTSASLPPAVAQAQNAQTAVDPSIVTADNTLGLDLFKILEMTMDHPFFCAIRDDDTEALLFIGTVVAPGQ